jgi:hypothetical protein
MESQDLFTMQLTVQGKGYIRKPAGYTDKTVNTEKINP